MSKSETAHQTNPSKITEPMSFARLEKALKMAIEDSRRQLKDTESSSDTDILAQRKLATIQKADSYDQLSHLYFETALSETLKDNEYESIIRDAAIKKALKYNQKSIVLWSQMEPSKDLTALRLGYLNILFSAFELNHKQRYLHIMENYIKTYFTQEGNKDISIEVTGLRLMIERNKAVVNLFQAEKLANNILKLGRSQMAKLSKYYDLAESFLEESAPARQVNQAKVFIESTVRSLFPKDKEGFKSVKREQVSEVSSKP